MNTKLYFFCSIFIALPFLLQAQVITDFAGNDTSGYSGDGGPATNARMVAPEGITVDNHGNVYFADLGNYVIRKVSGCSNTDHKLTGNCDVITTFAGNHQGGYSGDGGQATAATIGYETWGVGTDADGNVYIGDGNNVIRKVDTAGIITTFAGTGASGYTGDGGPASAATFKGVVSMAFDHAGNMYLCDLDNNVVRKINPAGIITTIAGTGNAGYSGDSGPATAARLSSPFAVALDDVGYIYIADWGNNVIRKIDIQGIIHTIAGTSASGYSGDGGQATAATFSQPGSLGLDSIGNIYVADILNNVIRKIDPSGVISTYAGNGQQGFGGNGGPATDATFHGAQNIAVSRSGDLYISDLLNYEVRVVRNTATSVPAVKVAKQAKLEVYPNPADGQCTINLISDDDLPLNIVITNLIGEQITAITSATNKPVNMRLDAPPGIYFVTAATPKGSYSSKIVIVR